MLVRLVPMALLLVLVSACAGHLGEAGKPAAGARQPDADATSPAVIVTSVRAKSVGSEAFWQTIEDARARGGGDPDAMAHILESRYAKADDETLRKFQRELVEVSSRLYSWRHWDAAEMICGYVSDDVFTDWRSWVITLGRETFTRIVENPDNPAEVAELSGGCEAGGEIFGAAVSSIYFERHGYEDENFPILEFPEAPQWQAGD
jgi:hypothetical protein